MLLDQSDYNIRCEWGSKGVERLGPISDGIIIVDVLSFSTSVEIATSQGAIVYPFRWNDERVREFARSVNAEVADRANHRGFSLSPSSLQALPANIRLVLPSPNGSEISVAVGAIPTLCGCIRNCRAVAESAMRKGNNIAVIPAGERWEDGSLRPCLEDFIGAGSIIRFLRGSLSPEAEAALRSFESSRENLFERLRDCGSGREKTLRGELADVALASEVNVSDCVPILTEGAYAREG